MINLNMYGLLYKSFNNDKIKNAKEKLKNNNLTIEEVLSESELVNSFKISSICQLQDVLTKDNLKQLIDFTINYPDEESINIGHKFPFNSCEILSSDNSKIIEKFFEKNKPDAKNKSVTYKFEDEDEDIKIDKFYYKDNNKEKDIVEKELDNKKLERNEKVKSILTNLLNKGKSSSNSSSDRGNSKETQSNKSSASQEVDIDKNSNNSEKDLLNNDNNIINIPIDDLNNLNNNSKALFSDNVNEVQSNANIDESMLANSPNRQNHEHNNNVDVTIEQQHANPNKKIESDDVNIKILSDKDNSHELAINQQNYSANNNDDKNIHENSNADLKSSTNISDNKPEANNKNKEDNLSNANNKSKEVIESKLVDANGEQTKIKSPFITNLEIPNEEEIKYPLLDQLFSFVLQSKPEGLNHVLCGYFHKIFDNLFINKPVQLVKYLFERSEIILSMVKHFNRISIVECLLKLVKYDTDSIILINKSCDEVKEEVFKEIFDYIDNQIFSTDEDPDVEVLHSLSEFFLECVEDRRTLLFFIKCPKFSLKLFETFLHASFANKLYVITQYLEKVYIELTFKENKKKDLISSSSSINYNSKFKTGSTFKIENSSIGSSIIGNKDEDVSNDCYYFLELFISMINYLFSRFKDEYFGLSDEKEIDNNIDDRQKKLGLPKIYIMCLTYQILKHAFYVFDKKYFHYEEDFFIDFYNKIITSDFFSTAVKYFLEFPWNNMYQNIFLDIIKEVLKYPLINKQLIEHIFYEIGFLEEMILCVIDEKYSCLSKYQFKNTEVQSGFLSFIIEIVYLVNECVPRSDSLKLICEKSKLIFY